MNGNIAPLVPLYRPSGTAARRLISQPSSPQSVEAFALSALRSVGAFGLRPPVCSLLRSARSSSKSCTLSVSSVPALIFLRLYFAHYVGHHITPNSAAHGSPPRACRADARAPAHTSSAPHNSPSTPHPSQSWQINFDFCRILMHIGRYSFCSWECVMVSNH